MHTDNQVLQLIQPRNDRTSRSNQYIRFITMVIIAIMTLTATQAQAAKILFRSNFSSGVSISAPYGFYGHGAWQQITGFDRDTGYSWPTTALGANFSGLQLITSDPTEPSTIGNYITNTIKNVTGPFGPINELFQNVKIKGDVGQANSQSVFLLNRSSKIGDINDFYMAYWIKYPADLVQKLDPSVSSGNWRYHFSFKTGGYDGNDSHGDYRISISILKGTDGKLYWLTMGDSDANGPVPKTTYWYKTNHIVPVPVGEWFKFEVYSRRSTGSDGRFWAAMNGQEIVDRQGPTRGIYNLPITRIIAHSAYSGGYGPVESHITGFEIWDGFPCGTGVSCYNFDKTAPTTPTSLTGRLSKFSSFGSVALAWLPSTDNVAVANYIIYRNGTRIGVSITPNFIDTISGSPRGALYSYTVRALDATGNFTPMSSAIPIVY
jgi:hypothetical protein